MAYVAAVPRLIYIAACACLATEEEFLFLEGCELFVFEYTILSSSRLLPFMPPFILFFIFRSMV